MSLQVMTMRFFFFVTISYPTRRQFDVIGLAIVNLLRLPPAKENIVSAAQIDCEAPVRNSVVLLVGLERCSANEAEATEKRAS